MSLNNSYSVAIIPARSGSKGIKNKNLQVLGEAPLLAWSIRSGLVSKNISRTVVSTNSSEYANIAEEWGAEVPFLRPEKISQDTSSDLEFVLHALEFFESEGQIPDMLIHLRPTTPFRNPEVIDKAITLAANLNNDITSLRSVHEMSESAYKSFEISQEGNLLTVFSHDTGLDASNMNRQSFPKTYSPNGYVDVLFPKYILSKNLLHGNKVKSFITDVVSEVDSESDFEFCKLQLASQPNKERLLFGGK